MKVLLVAMTFLGIMLNSDMKTLHDYTVKDITGEDFDLSSLKGKKVMVVNTASECGLTPQYEQLQELYAAYKDSNFTIIGFPSNDFGKQEPGTNGEIQKFCKLNYGVEFPMMSKVVVKGDNKADVYKFLTEKALNGLEDSEVQWNFQKYLIDEEGKLVRVVAPQILPIDSTIIEWIEG
ncbi:glutathione peroxidase [Lishizhenia tianjinensis]|uniref:Glutathione peroxidase n=1 Tax=Lishizhenia tianjinensis TaxID=477690 RepID=A0A1I6XZX5_9FLAO|nr:glutathione peroxidase [Lishizhenia tianjinensis]SFT43899.1 glutathione peroxidase [Lishizhenia tianjinensis]